MDIPLRAVLDALDDAVFVHSRCGLILDVNARALDMFRVSRERALQLSLARDCSVDPCFMLCRPGLWLSVSSGRGPLRLEWDARRPGDGSEFAAEIVLTRIDTVDGPAVLSTVRDVSWRRAGQKYLVGRAQDLARLNDELQRFAAAAAR